MRFFELSMAFLIVLGACTSEGKEPSPKAPPAPESKPQTDSKLELGKSEPSQSSIRWIEDEYPRALAEAKAKKLPLVIDMWADWCHTCLAMKHGVLRDQGLAGISDRYVWLSIDTENPSSAPVMAKFPVKAWPTFFVVSPEDEAVQAVQVGSTSVRGFRAFLTRGSEGHLAQGAIEHDEKSPLHHLRIADRARADGDYRVAARSYGTAIRLGGPSWDRKTDMLAAQIAALSHDDKKVCAEFAIENLPEVAKSHTVAAVDFTHYAKSCGEALPSRSRLHLQTLSVAAVEAIINDSDASLSHDDRSDALALLRNLVTDKPEQARRYALAQQELLSKAVSLAASAKEEMGYVWHQVEVHAFLEQGEKILPWVESLEKRLPKEYDPPYRRAWLLHKLDRHAEALKPAEIALSLAKGARRGRILGLIADLYKAQGNTKKERKTRTAALTHYQELPLGHRRQASIDRAQKSLDAMPRPAAKKSE